MPTGCGCARAGDGGVNRRGSPCRFGVRCSLTARICRPAARSEPLLPGIRARCVRGAFPRDRRGPVSRPPRQRRAPCQRAWQIRAKTRRCFRRKVCEPGRAVRPALSRQNPESGGCHDRNCTRPSFLDGFEPRQIHPRLPPGPALARGAFGPDDLPLADRPGGPHPLGRRVRARPVRRGRIYRRQAC